MITPAATSSWWKQTPIYHIYPRSFHDTNDDGIGDLPGIIEKLPYLADLGIGAIWMGPIFRSPQVDNGYDISDYRDIDPIFGTLADLDRLIATAHRYGIRVLLDLVFNHSSNQNRWFIESERDPAGPYGDYYIWRDAPEDAGEPAGAAGGGGVAGGARPRTAQGEPAGAALPNNWRSFFSGPTWTWSPARGQYYLHLFAPEQPDLNWDNPAVRRELAEIANFWLDRGADGFRLDVINFIAKADGLPSVAERPQAGGPEPGGQEAGGRGADAPQAGGPVAGGPERYLDHHRTATYLREFRSRLHRTDEIVLVGETPHLSYEWARELTAAENGPLDMVLLFDHLEVDHGPSGRWDPAPWTTEQLAHVLSGQQRALAGSSWPSLYMGNHDQPRIVSRYGDDRENRFASATALATLFYLQRGTPIIYQGDEIGMANYPLRQDSQIVDIESGNAYRALIAGEGVAPEEALRRVARNARDNGRTPMQWDADPSTNWWFPLNPDHREWNVVAQQARPASRQTNGSVLEYYRQLLALRGAHPALREGSFELLSGETPCIAYRRTAVEESITVVVNLSSDATPMPAAVNAHAGEAPVPRVLLRNVDDPDFSAEKLAPWETRVLLHGSSAQTRIEE